MVYKDTTENAVRTFQKAITTQLTDGSCQNDDKKKIQEAVVQYLKALYERDLKILRNLILQHLLCKMEKQHQEPSQENEMPCSQENEMQNLKFQPSTSSSFNDQCSKF